MLIIATVTGDCCSFGTVISIVHRGHKTKEAEGLSSVILEEFGSLNIIGYNLKDTTVQIMVIPMISIKNHSIRGDSPNRRLYA